MAFFGRCECGERMMREDTFDGGIRFQHGLNPEHSAVYGPDIWLDAPADAPHPRIVAWIETVHARAVSSDLREGNQE